MKDGISLILCCFNSANRLPITLEHISKQESLSDIPWEVIIVNNNSTDNTKSVATEQWEKCGTPTSLRVVDENTPGLTHARIKGVNEAQFEFVIFCDDDNWLNPDYLSRAYGIMNENSEIGILGGRSVAVFEGDEPLWFSTYQRSYAVGVQGLYSGDVTDKGEVWGAGMVVRTSVFLKLLQSKITFFSEDRKGKTLSSGGDSELCKWFILLKYKLWYDEGLVLQHYMPKARLTKNYLQELQQGFKRQSYVFSRYNKIIKIFRSSNSKREIWLKLIILNLKYLYANFILNDKKRIKISNDTDIKRPFYLDPVCNEILSNRKRYLKNFTKVDA